MGKKTTVHNLSCWWLIFVIVFILGLGYVSKNLLGSLPEPLGIKDQQTHPKSFIAERAWNDLKILNNFGPRPTGNYANEVLAIDFFKKEISYIQQQAHKNQKIYADIQKTTGSYWAAFKPHGMTNVYRNVQNVVVKLIGKSEGRTNDTLMLNCHFDSVAGSPGASDDAASCCVMLEILRVLSKQEEVNRHSIIFLFNGAEETPLQAAHGFITQHAWAKNIRAFLNLESVGSGGKEILFQAGPNHSWLIDMYKTAAPHPNGQAAAEELFHSGMVPSDTDFRIFRDFGHVPGMDFAHVINGYRYHTKYDHIDYIPQNVLQRTGDNILALVKKIANSNELAETDKLKEGVAVYYDILGLFFLSYPKNIGSFINQIISIASFLLPYLFLTKTTKGVNKKYVRCEILLGFFSTVFATILSYGVIYFIAAELDWSGLSMSWYSHPTLIVAVYCNITFLILCLCHIASNVLKNSPLSLGLKIQARLIGVNLIWSFLTCLSTGFGYRIGYVTMIPLLVMLICNLIINFAKLQNSPNKWLYIHLFGQLFVVLWTTHFYHLMIDMFVPIAGRSGARKNPDIVVGVLATLLTVFVTSNLVPLVILVRRAKIVLIGLFSIMIFTRVYIIQFTEVGFPYRDDTEKFPTPQRLFVAHTLRTLYDEKGNVRFVDSGYWMREIDRNSKRTIESLVAPLDPIDQRKNPLCEKEVFCGLPFYSCGQLHTGGYWVQAPRPIIREKVELSVLSNSTRSSMEKEIKLRLNGSHLFSLQIRPKPDVELKYWDISDKVPEPNEYYGQKAYFVMVTHGLEADPMDVTLRFELPKANYKGPVVDITVVTFHWEYHKEHTSDFALLLARIPKWAFAVPAVASLESWTF